jgi:tryptophan synthase alpha chain
MTYYNLIFRMGEEEFCRTASEAGVDGVIVPDLPPEEAGTLLAIAEQYKLATVFLVSPTSPPERLSAIAAVSTGFIYCVSVTGVTGARDSLSDEISPMISQLREHSYKPVCVGFGVSTRKQAQEVAKLADGAIVGSAIINVIEQHLDNESAILANVEEFAEELARGVKQR